MLLPARGRAEVAPAARVVLHRARARAVRRQVARAVAQLHGDVRRLEGDRGIGGHALATLLLAGKRVAHAEAVGERQQLFARLSARGRTEVAPAARVILHRARARAVGHQVARAVAQLHHDVRRLEGDRGTGRRVLTALLLTGKGVVHAEAVGERQQLFAGLPACGRAEVTPAAGVILHRPRARAVWRQVARAVAQFHHDARRLEGDNRVAGHVLGHVLGCVGVSHAEGEVTPGRGNVGDQGATRIGAARDGLPASVVILRRRAGQTVTLAV